jgi:peptidoglycan/LPS O-acetylase OafA/YrhL
MKSRIQPIDGLRTLSALGVVWVHVWAFYQIPQLKFFSIDFYQIISIVGNGVDFFFVISGFCMYLMSVKTSFNRNTYLHFLYKRFIRLAPAFYVSILVIKFHNTAFPFFYNVIFHFLFLNNVVTGNTISAPFWSIGTEWHFYMLLPIVLLFARKMSLIRTIIILSLMSIILFCIVNLGYLPYDWWEKQILIRFPEFGLGIIAAYYFKKDKKLPAIFAGGKGLLLALLIMYVGRAMKFTPVLLFLKGAAFFVKSIAETFLATGFAILLYHVVTQKSAFSSWLSGKSITFIGRISYSIYLWHSLVIYLLTNLLVKFPFGKYNLIPGFILVSIITIILSHFSYLLLESFYFKK